MTDASAEPATRFTDFIRAMTMLVARESAPAALVPQTIDLLKPLLNDGGWLPDQFAQPRPESYQQYLLYCDPLERFCVVSFVWNTGQKTPIHDHMTWGAVGVLKGREISTNYRCGKSGMEVTGVDALDVGGVIGITPDAVDIHQVDNGIAGVTISIHVYGGNIGRIVRQRYDPASGEARDFVSGYSAAVLPNFWG